jgi:hypothetical protein
MKKPTLENYRIIKQACLLEKNPHILNGILSEIPVKWANNFEIGDIITIVNILRQYSRFKRKSYGIKKAII